MNKIENSTIALTINPQSPQCQYYVMRKKRLCRMTVKPGRQYCGEHEPQPKTDHGKDDKRIPCPNDPKHTCYASKLEKHLSICNARQQQQPDYIVPNINGSSEKDDTSRLPLSQVPVNTILAVIEKVNTLYDKYVKDKIPMLPEQPIHSAVLNEFNEQGRTETSLRHLRQVSRLLHIIESQELVQPNTCYVELGAGKGHLSYYAWWAWCQGTNSSVVLVDRASLRHKRDNKLRDSNANANQSNEDTSEFSKKSSDNQKGSSDNVHRIRADLAHLALDRVSAVRNSDAVVGYAKHLCGVATDYALGCLAAGGAHGVVLATCCHHRVRRAACLAARPLQELGLTAEEFDVLLGVVSWATCGDGRSRSRPAPPEPYDLRPALPEPCDPGHRRLGTAQLQLTREQRERVGKRAKILLDWGRVLYLRERGFDARLVYYVPPSVSLENVCILARRT